MKKAVIILPTYNEEGSIEKLIRAIFAEEKKTKIWELHILVVDSYSKDKTAAIVRSLKKQYPHLHLLEMEKEGLGKAYVNGFAYAMDHINPFVIFEMDADLSHDPADIPRFLEKIATGADFVIGSRYMKGGAIPPDWGIHRKLFSVIGNLIIRFGFMKLSVTEWTNGYRAIKTWVIKDAFSHIKNYSGYVFQVAFLDYALKHNARISEIPIKFVDRKWGKSKINAFQYISHTLLYVFLNSSFIKYVIVGGTGFIIDSVLLYTGYHFLKLTVTVSKIISSETAIVSNFLLNNFWAFSHKKLEHNAKTYGTKFVVFNFASIPSIIFQTVGIYLLTVIFGNHLFYPVAYNAIVVILVVIPYSYFVYNRFIWKDSR